MFLYMCLLYAQPWYWLDVEEWSCCSQASIRLKDLANLDKEKWSFIENTGFLIKNSAIKTDQINRSDKRLHFFDHSPL